MLDSINEDSIGSTPDIVVGAVVPSSIETTAGGLSKAVDQIARKLMFQLQLRPEDLDDLIQEGQIALLKLTSSFDPSRGVKLEAYVRPRIRGAMLDFIRENDFVPRRIRAAAHRMAQARDHLTKPDGTPPTVEEMAESLQISVERFRVRREKNLIMKKASLDKLPDHDLRKIAYDGDAEADLIQREFDLTLSNAMTGEVLQPRERRILEAYYLEEDTTDEVTLSSIGRELGISSSRVFHLKGAALKKLREAMKDVR